MLKVSKRQKHSKRRIKAKNLYSSFIYAFLTPDDTGRRRIISIRDKPTHEKLTRLVGWVGARIGWTFRSDIYFESHPESCIYIKKRKNVIITVHAKHLGIRRVD